MDRVVKSTHHRRRHSWPPVRLSKKRLTEKNIDENPFSFFISPPDERQSYLFDNIDAGIEPVAVLPPSTSRTKCRKPLRRWRQRAQAQKAVNKLKHWIKRMEKFYRSDPLPDIVEVVAPPTPLVDQMILPTMFPCPIREETEPAPSVQRRIRSHSARPRSWVDPSADLWTVFEENEETMAGGLGQSVPALPRRRPYP